MTEENDSARNGGPRPAISHSGSAADIYRVQPYYQRFNQKNNMIRQPLWNPEAAQKTRERFENLSRMVKENRKGYRLQDWAFYVGAMANMVNSGFVINSPNRRGNSWAPLSRRSEIQAASQPYANYGKIEVDPAGASRFIKKVATQFGAHDVGFCVLDRQWVYSHWFDEETGRDYPIVFSDESGYEACREPVQLDSGIQVIPKDMKYVVVLVHEMDVEGMSAAPTLTQMATTLTTYSQISSTTVMIAEFIRGLGYNAIPSANDTALSIPLAIDAGLGELSRNAKLIHPAFGPRCRISKVITDLPLAVARPRMRGVTEFCSVCGKCARECPAGAISTGERSFEPLGSFSQSGVFQWQMDHLKCYNYWTRVGTNCGICIRVCPFNKPGHRVHDIARWFVRKRNREVDSLLARFDDVLGYGRFRDPDLFWED